MSVITIMLLALVIVGLIVLFGALFDNSYREIEERVRKSRDMFNGLYKNIWH